MTRRIRLTDREINIIVQSLEEQKNKASLHYIVYDVGAVTIEDLIGKLLQGRSGDVTIASRLNEKPKEAK